MRRRFFPGLQGLLAATLIMSCSSSPSIPWTKDLEGALKQAAAQDKSVITYLYTDWCTYCLQMENSTFQDPILTKEMAANHFWVKLNAETDAKGIELNQKYLISSYPTFVLMDSSGEEIDRMDGYISAEDFQEAIRWFLNSPTSYGNLRKKAQDEPDSISAQYNLGEAHLDRNQFGKAAIQFAKVISQGGDDHVTASAYFYLAYSLYAGGQTETALDQLDQLETRFPGSKVLADATVLRGRIYFMEGKLDQSRAVLAEFIEEYPEHGHRQMVLDLLQVMDSRSSSDSMSMAASH